jgi:hypothetical protein
LFLATALEPKQLSFNACSKTKNLFKLDFIKKIKIFLTLNAASEPKKIGFDAALICRF